MCAHNPNRVCQGNFAARYWVGDTLKAVCGGEIAIKVYRHGDNPEKELYEKDVVHLHVEVSSKVEPP